MKLSHLPVPCAVWLIFAVLLPHAGVPLRAEEVVFRATGYVTQTTHPDISINDPFEIVFAFETTTPGSWRYLAGTWVSMQFGSVEKAFEAPFWMEVVNDQPFSWYPTGTLDEFEVYFPPNNIPFVSNALQLIAYNEPGLFDSSALPLVPPPILPDLATNFARLMDEDVIIFEDPEFDIIIYAHAQGPITNLELVIQSPDVLTENLAVDIIELVDLGDIPQGTGNALVSKLEQALDALTADNATWREDASGKMGAFINFVEAQRGKKIDAEIADELIESALSIIDALE